MAIQVRIVRKVDLLPHLLRLQGVKGRGRGATLTQHSLPFFDGAGGRRRRGALPARLHTSFAHRQTPQGRTLARFAASRMRHVSHPRGWRHSMCLGYRALDRARVAFLGTWPLAWPVQEVGVLTGPPGLRPVPAKTRNSSLCCFLDTGEFPFQEQSELHAQILTVLHHLPKDQTLGICSNFLFLFKKQPFLCSSVRFCHRNPEGRRHLRALHKRFSGQREAAPMSVAFIAFIAGRTGTGSLQQFISCVLGLAPFRTSGSNC